MAVAHEASTSVRLPPALSEEAERMYQEHAGWIYGYCLRILRSPEEAEDALQVTYLNACRALNDGVVPRVDSAWLLRIAQNVCLTRLRSSGRRARLETLQDVTLLEETVAAPTRRAEELIGLGDALATLPEQQRRALLLREWQGLSYAEVGARLELTQSAVETLLFRARRSLARALENPGASRRRLRLAHMFDIAGLYYVLKSVFAGSAAAQVAAATAVVATTATIVATDPAGVWRDRPSESPPPARSDVAAPSRPLAATAAVAPAPVLAPELVAEREFFAQPGGPAAQGVDGRTFGRETAERAKAKEKGSNGKGEALSHAKQAEGKAKAKGPKKETPSQGGSSGSANGGGAATAPGPQKAKAEPATGGGTSTGSSNGNGNAQAKSGEESAPTEVVEASKGKAGKSK